MKMSKISKANLLVADGVVIVQVSDSDKYQVQVFRGDRSGFLSTSVFPVEYVSVEAASRAVRRIRPDLEPTTI